MTAALRSLAALVLGYSSMVLLQVLFQEVMFGGLHYGTSPLWHLVVGGGLTVLSAVAGGWVGASLAGRAPMLHGGILSAMTLTEGTYLQLSGRFDGPLWFDTLAVLSLVVGLLSGAFLAARSRQPARGVAATN